MNCHPPTHTPRLQSRPSILQKGTLRPRAGEVIPPGPPALSSHPNMWGFCAYSSLPSHCSLCGDRPCLSCLLTSHGTGPQTGCFAHVAWDRDTGEQATIHPQLILESTMWSSPLSTDAQVCRVWTASSLMHKALPRGLLWTQLTRNAIRADRRRKRAPG